MPIHPDDYASSSTYDLLIAAGRGHLVLDQRAVSAIVADPARSLPEVLRFAAEDHIGDRVDISEDMMALFAIMPTPDALPYLMSEIRRFPDDVPDAMLDALMRIGPPALDALLALEDLGDNSEVPFLAAAIGRTSHPAVRAMIEKVRQTNPEEGEFLDEVGEGDAEEPLPFDYRQHFPEEIDPDLQDLEEEDRREFLASPHADFRLLALREYVNTDPTVEQTKRLLEIGATDPDARVRGMAWEALRERTHEEKIAATLLARLETPGLDPWERAGLACGLAYLSDDKLVRRAIDESYEHLETRALAIEAMWRTLDRAYARRIQPHLGDGDPDIRSEAVTAVGFLRMREELPRLRAIMLDDECRHDALHSYMLAAPVPAESRFELKRLRAHVEELAGGFNDLDEAVVDQAIETRLELVGHSAAPAAQTRKAASTKVGRNDPCPCGSGRKYKKCCGAG